MTLGERILIQRRRKEMTQRELAQAAELNTNTIARLEQGNLHDLGGKSVVRLANVLGVTTDYLLGRTDEETTPVTKWQGKRMRRTFGNELEGKIHVHDDFDAPLPEFADYM